MLATGYFFGSAKIAEFSYSDLPQSDAFFLTVAVLAIAVPPLIIFFSAPVWRKIAEIRHVLFIRPLIYRNDIRGFLYDWKKETISADQTRFFKSNPGNFLSLVNGLSNVFRLAVEKRSGDVLSQELVFDEISEIILKKKILTRSGVRKIKFLEWLNETIVSGGIETVSGKTLELGVRIVWDLNKEFNGWLSSEKTK